MTMICNILSLILLIVFVIASLIILNYNIAKLCTFLFVGVSKEIPTIILFVIGFVVKKKQ